MASQNPNMLKRLYENVMGTPEQNAKAEKDIAAYKAAKEKEKEKEKKDKEKEGKTAMAKGGAVKKKKVKMAEGGAVGGRQVMPAVGQGRNPEWAARAAQRQVARQVRQDTREKEKAARQAAAPVVREPSTRGPNPLIQRSQAQRQAIGQQTAMAKGGDVKLKSAPKAAKAGKAKPVLAIMIGVPKGKAKMAKGGKVTKKKGC